jgi:hypothetical protein
MLKQSDKLCFYIMHTTVCKITIVKIATYKKVTLELGCCHWWHPFSIDVMKSKVKGTLLLMMKAPYALFLRNINDAYF